MRTYSILATSILAAAIVAAGAQAGSGSGRSLHIVALKNTYRYDVTSLTAPAGQITIVFTNDSTHQHNVSLEQGETEYGATVTIGPGATSTIFTLKKGSYHFYSSYGNDEDHGMSGTLKIT
jgi:plastocyanin